MTIIRTLIKQLLPQPFTNAAKRVIRTFIRGSKDKALNDYEILSDPDPLLLERQYGNAWKNSSIPLQQLSLTERELPNFMDIPSIRSLVELMRDIKTNKTLSVLEVGCSTGYYSEAFAKAGLCVKYEGCDYSPAFIELAREKYPETIFKVSDATNLAYGDAQFDIVVSGSCISHIVNHEQAIAEAARVANTWVIFHRTPVVHLSKTLFAKKTGYGVRMLSTLFNEERLVNLFRTHGLDVRRVTAFASFPVKDLQEPVFVKSYLCKKRRDI